MFFFAMKANKSPHYFVEKNIKVLSHFTPKFKGKEIMKYYKIKKTKQQKIREYRFLEQRRAKIQSVKVSVYRMLSTVISIHFITEKEKKKEKCCNNFFIFFSKFILLLTFSESVFIMSEVLQSI